jgi:hypothetical protein
MATSQKVKSLRGWVVRDEEYRLEGTATWRAAEEWLCERYGWEDVDASTHDAVDADGERIEIKSCRVQHEDGGFGRAVIWDRQYWSADVLALAVCAEVNGEVGIVAHGVVAMDEVEYEPCRQNHPTMGPRSTYLCPKWTELLKIADVRAGLRHAFTDVMDVPDQMTLLPGPDLDCEE